MAGKIVIDIFRTKQAEELINILSDPESKLETGSGAALTAATASALLMRAAKLAEKEKEGDERREYIVRNAGILRDYMVRLIDEDVKSRGPLHRAMVEGGEREIEASRHPAMAICAEIINMMGKCIELLEELCAICPKDALHYVGESAELAAAAMKSARLYVVDMADKCSDDTFRYVTRRENELMLGEFLPKAKAIAEKVYAAI